MAARTALPLLLAIATGTLAPAVPSAAPIAADGDGAPQPAGAPSGDAAELLAAHNQYRARHCAPPLGWSDDLTRVAQAWADRLARDCSFQHSGGKYGENLWAGTAGAFTPRQVAASWYDEAAKYDFKRPGFSMSTGHFTQVVWVGTKRLGCGTATCKGMRLWVCNYDPPGNVEGDFPRNVLPTSCRK